MLYRNFCSFQINTSIKQVCSNTRVQKETKGIMYGGRDILKLEINTRPLQWQLESPLKDCYKSEDFCHAKYSRSYFRLEDGRYAQEYLMVIFFFLVPLKVKND